MPEETDDDTAPVIDPGEHAKLALENTLLRAGVDLDSEQGKLVQQAWAGRTPDLEAIKGQWELVKPAAVVVEPPVERPAEERIGGEAEQAEERRLLANNSVVEPNPEDDDPNTAALKAGLGVLTPPFGTAAGTRDDAQAAVMHTLLDAAARGDSRVLVRSDAPSE